LPPTNKPKRGQSGQPGVYDAFRLFRVPPASEEDVDPRQNQKRTCRND